MSHLIHRANPGAAILWGGLSVGVLDITAALVIYGRFGLGPLRLLQGIAAGLLGQRAFEGGIATALLGLLCHFTIAFGAATVYVFATRLWPTLLQYTVVTGPLYGIAVYWFMQLVVVAHSGAVKYPFSLKLTLIGNAIHIFCVGLPIAIAARRFGPY